MAVSTFDQATTAFDSPVWSLDGVDQNAPPESFPTLSVNLGFNISPTVNYLVLDDPTRGKLNTATLAPNAGVWTDITAYVFDITTSRGRNRLLQAYKTGSCSLRLDNSDGRFDPNNLAGPYVANSVTQLQPEVLVWIN